MSADPPIETALASGSDARLALLQKAVEANPGSATLLYRLADEYAERGDDDAYARTFRAAFCLRPSLQMLRRMGFPPDAAEAALVRRRARTLAARGVAFAPVLAALAVAEAALGQRGAVEALVDYARFFRLRHLPAPAGFSGGDFHDRIADEVRTKLRYHGNDASNAIRKGWRNFGVLDQPTPAIQALRAMLLAAISDYIGEMRRDDHLFAAACPAAFKLGSWAIVSNGESHHVPHVHGHAWLTGVYYVRQPPVSRGSTRGWLRVGAPPARGIGPGQGWQERLVAPEPGNLVLMPGYFFHDTQPMDVDQERICIAFDVVPDELAGVFMAEED